MNDIAPPKVGDPDPTDHGLPDELLCPEVDLSGNRFVFYCSQVADHDGPHIAGNGTEVLAVWP